MTLKNSKEYLNSLRDGREIYYRGKRVEDVTTHPVLSIPITHAKRFYELRDVNEELRKLLVINDPTLGEISGFYKICKSPEDLWYRSKIIQETTRLSGGLFNIVQAIGSDALHALFIVAKKMDAENNKGYTERVKRYYEYVAKNDLALAVAQTDVKGDRTKRPHEQIDKDLYVRIVDVRDDGIIVRGAKVHTTQSIASNEIIFLPYRTMVEDDKDYAVAFAIPTNTKGLKLIVRPMIEIEGLPSREDAPLSSRHAEAETMTILDDVFIPWERVFMFKEWKYAGELANLFALYHRFTAISYRIIEADLYLGTARLVAKVNGLDNVSHVRDEILDIVLYREIMYMGARLAALEALIDQSTGIAIPNPIYTNIGKLYSNTNFVNVLRGLVDITGGIISTLPSTEDFKNPEERAFIEKYLKANPNYSGEERFKVLRLARELAGGPFTGYMLGWMIHAEGSMAASKIALYREYDFSRAEELAKNLISEK
ncbi:MAG: 4-hydroxyphenylacetate 3-hydroxylase N-terminal domain-containing protein [Sulfolobaceae archaeon]